MVVWTEGKRKEVGALQLFRDERFFVLGRHLAGGHVVERLQEIAQFALALCVVVGVNLGDQMFAEAEADLREGSVAQRLRVVHLLC
jgi:hypothetical protein